MSGAFHDPARLISFFADEFAKNPAEWLSFLSTAILGLVTVYFAARTRALERQQVRQINREFDRELVEAEMELNVGASLGWYWEQWGGNRDVETAVSVFIRARQNIRPPELAKVRRILAFHLPGTETRASRAVIKLSASLSALDSALSSSGGAVSNHVKEVALRLGSVIEETSQQLQEIIDQIATKRKKLRA